jgi:hydrogenase nickel incorporation protein HypB
MCDTCGCGVPGEGIRYIRPGEENQHDHDHEHDPNGLMHSHPHSHEHGDGHVHDHPAGQEIRLERDILGKNNLLAERNRGFFEGKDILAINLVSSPGSGKTSLLERTVKDLGRELQFYIIEGDQQTMLDAERIDKAGAPVVQVNTGNGCHLDAQMIQQASRKLEISNGSVLVIENVGNLVCPSLFDLGEHKRVVIISTTEGEDKPAKYPTMFQSSHLCIINKTDLLPYVDFNMDKCKDYALRVNPDLEFLEISAKTGEGMAGWYSWIRRHRA